MEKAACLIELLDIVKLFIVWFLVVFFLFYFFPNYIIRKIVGEQGGNKDRFIYYTD